MYMYILYIHVHVHVQHLHVFGTYICSCQTVKTKEEKEVLEHFAGVVSSSVVTNMCMYNVLYM